MKFVRRVKVVAAAVAAACLLLPAVAGAGVLEDALGNPVDRDGVTPLTVTTEGNAPWSVDAGAADGSAAARSGAVGDGMSSAVVTTVTGPATLSFLQKVSSEPGYDTLSFSVDGSVKYRASGEVKWQQKVFALSSGTHTLRWKYAKNASGSRGSDAAWLSGLVVSSVSAVKIVAPNGGENVVAGAQASVSWRAPAAAERFDVYVSTNGGSTWNLAAGDYPGNPSGVITCTSFTWPAVKANSAACKVKVVAKNDVGAVVGTDVSDRRFAVNNVRLVAPNGGNVLQAGEPYDISWEAAAAVSTFALSYSFDNGRTWQDIATVSGSTYRWTVPAPAGDRSACRIRISALDSGGTLLGTDISDAPFVTEVVKITSPDGGESLSPRQPARVAFTVYGSQSAATAQVTYSTDNGASWQPVTTLKGSFTAGSYSCSWNVPSVTAAATSCRMKVVLKNAAGGVVATDVSDATFTILPVYTLSGSVTAGGAALAGVTVTLGDAASATTTTDSSGRYSFANLLNGSYTVTPTRAGYTFSPATAARTVAGVNVSGVNFTGSVVTSGWTAGTQIGTVRSVMNYYHLYSLDVALNDGNAGMAVWSETYSNTSSIWANRFVSGAWGVPLQVSTGVNSAGPKVAVDAAGNATVVWTDQGMDQYGIGILSNTIVARRFAAATGTWGTPVRVSAAPVTDSTFFAYGARIALDAQGLPVVVWEQIDPDTPVTSIWFSRYDGSSWSAPRLVSGGTRNASDPQVAVDGGNNVFVVWDQDTYAYDPGQSAFYNATCNIWGARYGSVEAAWAAPTLIGDPSLATGDGTERPRIAVNAGGAAFVAWQQRSAASGIAGAGFDSAAGSWSAPGLLAAGSWLAWPAVGLDDAGNAFLAWIDTTNTTNVGYVRRYDAASSAWGNPTVFESGSGDVSEVAVRVNGGGDAMLVWTAERVKASRYGASGWSAATGLLSGNGMASAINARGGVLAVSADSLYDPYQGFMYAPFAAFYRP